MIDIVVVSRPRFLPMAEAGLPRPRGTSVRPVSLSRTISRTAIHACISEHLRAAGSSGVLAYTDEGRPVLEGAELGCSISHSDNVGIFVVGPGDLGIDIQFDNVAWDALGAGHSAWVAREAVSKFLALGLALDLHTIAVPPLPSDRWEPVRVLHRSVFLRQVSITRRYKAVVACETPRVIRRWFMARSEGGGWLRARWP